MFIEQAIFTSAKTSRGDGYQLVACSRGVSEDDARELAVWGPSHGALCENRDQTSSVNFHQLTSGTYCVSKTVAAGQEFSGRGGSRIYTQFLLVPDDVFTRFANNPFAVLRAAWAKGLLNVHERVPATLERSSLVGRTAIVDEGLLAQLADQWGAERVGYMVAAAISPGQVLLAGASNTETLLGGLINCFPAECRTQLSFTTGLRGSPRRPFRIIPTDLDATEQRRLERQDGVTVVDLASTDFDTHELKGWANHVAQAIRSDQLPRLVSQLQAERSGLRLDQLNELGEELIRELDGVQVASKSAGRTNHAASKSRSSSANCTLRTDLPAANREAPSASSMDAICLPPLSGNPVSGELFEELEDAVYNSIYESNGSCQDVATLWMQLSQTVKPENLAAAREQFIRYTITLWEACRSSGTRDADKAVRALEVLTTLFDHV